MRGGRRVGVRPSAGEAGGAGFDDRIRGKGYGVGDRVRRGGEIDQGIECRVLCVNIHIYVYRVLGSGFRDERSRQG